MGRLPLLFSLLVMGHGALAHAEAVPSHSLLLVHSTTYYHSSPTTIEATQNLVAEHVNVYALTQFGTSDRRWYGPVAADPGQNLHVIFSRAGEHDLTPSFTSSHFTLTVAGGYHSACLGRALAEIIAKFLDQSRTNDLELVLPLAAIYSGFLFEAGELSPATPYWESILDESIDGLNYLQVTESMHDERFAEFMRGTVELVLAKHPIRQTGLANVEIRLQRAGRHVLSFNAQNSARSITFSYQ